MASGKRQHGTITVVKEIDAASPKFAQAFDTNEVLRQVVIAYRSGGIGAGAGKAKTAQKIMLTNATITGLQKVGNTERITIDYQQIEVTYVNGSKAATDDWDAK
jgi:type VI secretion system Hcp family effector